MDEECIYCGKDCKCEEYELYQDVAETHDLNAELKGFLQTKTIILYASGFIPTFKDAEVPCIMFSVLDQELSTKDIPVMKPVHYINLTKEQSDNIIKFLGGE